MSTLSQATEVRYRTLAIDGLNLFYREANPTAAASILLLHGFPSSSHMFRNLIPLLADTHRVVAPDLPGFGFSDMPAPTDFAYTFDNYARVIERFTEQIGLEHYAMYVFDYGAPVGFRLALSHPERVTALITQNGNAYEVGLSGGWSPIQRYWQEPTPENREALRTMLTLELTRFQYFQGVSDPTRIAPEGYMLDQFLLDRPGNADIQLALFLDYQHNVALYPRIQEYFRTHRPPTLAVWGKNDPFFLPAGAEAFRQDNPDTEIHLLDTGHFALETHAPEIAERIRTFLARPLTSAS